MLLCEDYTQNMLLKFRFSNFQAFRTEQELSLIASTAAGSSDGVFSPSGLVEQVLSVAGIYGANASGKTAVIRALGFMSDAVGMSHSQWLPDARIPVEPFRGQAKTEPSEFAVDILLGGVRHEYGFAVNSEAVCREWLYVYPRGARQVWFERTEHGSISFGTEMPGENKTIEALVRKNSLFLSAAAQNNHLALSPIYSWFSHRLSFRIADRAVYGANAAQFCEDERDRAVITRLLAHADLGITDIQLEDIPWPETAKNYLELVATWPVAATLPGKQVLRVIRLLHRIGDRNVALEPRQESNGTVTYLSLIGPIVSALKWGEVLCIDELDASLHPLIAIELIRLFTSQETNPQSAQLIFNTHDTNLLSSGVLRRDQIWFTEKDSDGSSHLYPLTDFKPRRQENLENGYLQGRYGAIPFIHPDYLSGAAGGNGEKS